MKRRVLDLLGLMLLASSIAWLLLTQPLITPSAPQVGSWTTVDTAGR